ncbi:MAG TPA: DNAase [Desulfobulbaceae bacterium]|nr:DNAase [Desulfobulbaceae bacterium]
MELVDTHCHLDIEECFPPFEEVLGRAKAAGVLTLIFPGVTQAGWQRMMDLSGRLEGLHAAPGLHPMYLARHRPEHLEELKVLAGQGGVVAIGEIGLDYYVENLDRNVQQQLFEAQLQIALAARLPVLLHIRKAHDQVLATLRRKRFTYGGIVHAYNGSLQQAEQFMQMGFCISVCGTLTYDRARKIRKIAAELPREALVLETDAPDIPPAGHKGESNLPEFLPEVLDALAALRGEPRELVASYTTENARRVLKLRTEG